MKKLILAAILVSMAGLSANAGGWHHGHRHHRSSVSFHFGATPYHSYSCSPWYSRSYVYYPSYGYSYGYPAYDYGYSYSRPNYAVGGTLLGALAGGIIGHNVNRQGWEGAGIGAAAGLVLGSIAESGARSRERAAYSSQPVYSQPGSTYETPASSEAPAVSAQSQVQNAPTYQPVSAMSGANGLFGR